MSVIESQFEQFYRAYLKQAHACLDLVDATEVSAVIEALWAAYKAGKRVYVAGNGGSAATAIHLVCCLTQGTMVIGKPKLRSEALVGNIASLTAIGNDHSYDQVFVRQLENCLEPGDVFLAISCSGNSPNVVSAAEYANSNGATTISLLGFGGGKLHKISKHSIYINNHDYGHVESAHVALGHLISQFLKQRIAE